MLWVGLVSLIRLAFVRYLECKVREATLVSESEPGAAACRFEAAEPP